MATTEGKDEVRLPVYDGTGDYHSWKQKVQVKALDWDDEGKTPDQQVRKALLLLSGAAFSTATHGGDITKRPRTLQELFQRLEERVPEHLSKSQALGELMKLRQYNDSLQTYTAKFEHLAAVAGIEQQAVSNVFYAGLSSQIKKELGPVVDPEGVDYRTLWAAARRAEEAVMREKGRKEREASRKGGKGRTRGRRVHTTRETGDGKPGGGETRTCFGCGKPGHLKRDCKSSGNGNDAQADGKRKGRGGAARGKMAREADLAADDIDLNIDDSDGEH